jgi:hypothetical protein
MRSESLSFVTLGAPSLMDEIHYFREAKLPPLINNMVRQLLLERPAKQPDILDCLIRYLSNLEEELGRGTKLGHLKRYAMASLPKGRRVTADVVEAETAALVAPPSPQKDQEAPAPSATHTPQPEATPPPQKPHQAAAAVRIQKLFRAFAARKRRYAAWLDQFIKRQLDSAEAERQEAAYDASGTSK